MRATAVDEWDLTPRQREVLIMVCDGKGNKEIAQTLWLSVKTVEKHRGKLCERLGTTSAAVMCRWAIRAGLIDP